MHVPKDVNDYLDFNWVDEYADAWQERGSVQASVPSKFLRSAAANAKPAEKNQQLNQERACEVVVCFMTEQEKVLASRRVNVASKRVIPNKQELVSCDTSVERTDESITPPPAPDETDTSLENKAVPDLAALTENRNPTTAPSYFVTCEQMVGIQCFQVLLPPFGAWPITLPPEGISTTDALKKIVESRLECTESSAALRRGDGDVSDWVLLNLADSTQQVVLVAQSCSVTVEKDSSVVLRLPYRTNAVSVSAMSRGSSDKDQQTKRRVDRRALKTALPGDITCAFCGHLLVSHGKLNL